MNTKESGLTIQWFPGHMAKTRRIMKENLKNVDVVVELRDARIPRSSKNPVIEELVKNKARVILLAKEDLANPQVTKQWIEYFKRRKLPAIPVDTRSGKGLTAFPTLVRETLAPLLARRIARGEVGRPIRMMIVGIPNVGKSSLINRMAGGKKLKVEDRPGVTLQKQWIKVEDGMELLDMPGVLWPKFQDPLVAENLAFTGAIKDNIMDTETLAFRLAKRLNDHHAGAIEKRFNLKHDDLQGLEGHQILEAIGRKRGMLIHGGEIDYERASLTLLDEFRAGLLGRISLELPPTSAKKAQDTVENET